jgi:hypothetical protein
VGDRVLHEIEQVVLAVRRFDVREAHAAESFGVLSFDGDDDLGLVVISCP